MNALPVFLTLSGKRVLLVGGGAVAGSKLAPLLEAGAEVTVVAPRIRDELALPSVNLVRRSFEPEDLDGCWFAVAAAPPEVNQAVARAAHERHIFVNAVDDMRSATAWLGGVVRKGGVTLAISTNGRAPALAGLLREAMQGLLPDDLSQWMEVAEDLRRRWKAERVPMRSRRPLLLQALAGLYGDRP